MRVLVADAFPARRLAQLTNLGVQVVYRPELNGDTLASALGGIEVLIVRSTEVRAPVIAGADALVLVVRAGAGVNTIDVAAASGRGILVASCPGKNSVAVAELTMGLILSLDRRIPDNVAAAREGRWDKKTFSEARGLHGRQLGLAGFGAIGRAVAARALAFGMSVTVWSRSLDDETAARAGVARAATFDDLLSSDVLSLHLPASKDTNDLLGARRIERLREGALVVNTARAALVDEGAMRTAVAAGRVRYAADVLRGEPAASRGALDSDLARTDGIYLTHHIGASTEQAQDAIAAEAVRLVNELVQTGQVTGGVVNLRKRSRAAATLVVRHLDRVGVLAEVLGVLREAGLNVQEMENELFEGDSPRTAIARIGLEVAPAADTLEKIRGREAILHAAVYGA